MNTQQIMDILPHRSPFLLIDTVEELEPGSKVSFQSKTLLYQCLYQ
jgi:3-hydroxymyristoyl/3-hydroxydecanoyl-(acyl carrier protein) dehydratase